MAKGFGSPEEPRSPHAQSVARACAAVGAGQSLLDPRFEFGSGPAAAGRAHGPGVFMGLHPVGDGLVWALDVFDEIGDGSMELELSRDAVSQIRPVWRSATPEARRWRDDQS